MTKLKIRNYLIKENFSVKEPCNRQPGKKRIKKRPEDSVLCVQSAVCACSCYFQQCAVETEPTCQSSPCGTSIAHLAKVKYMFFENIYLFSMVLSNKKD